MEEVEKLVEAVGLIMANKEHYVPEMDR